MNNEWLFVNTNDSNDVAKLKDLGTIYTSFSAFRYCLAFENDFFKESGCEQNSENKPFKQYQYTFQEK